MANYPLHPSESSLLHRGNPASVRSLPVAQTVQEQHKSSETETASRFIVRGRPIFLTLPPLVLLSGLSALALTAQQDARLLHPQPVMAFTPPEGVPEGYAALPPQSNDQPGAPNPFMAPGQPGFLPGQPPSQAAPGTGTQPMPVPGAGRMMPGAIAGLPPAPQGIPGRPSGPMSFPPGLPSFQPPNLPSNPAAVAFKRGVEAQQKKQFPQAIAAYQEVLRRDPQAWQAHGNIALIYLQNKQPEKALPHLRQAAKIEPNNPAFSGQLAETLLALKRPQEAIEPLRQVIKLSPENRAAKVALAQALAGSGQYPQAYTQWTQLAKADTNDSQAAFAAGVLAYEKLKRPTEALQWARQAWQAGDWKKDASKKYAGEPGVPLLLGRLLTEQKKPAEAEKVLAAGVAQFPALSELSTRLADVRWSQGNKDGAVQALRAAISQVPDKNAREQGQLRIALGRAYATQKQWPAALGELKQAAALLPKEVEPRVLFGEALLKAGRKEEAVTQLRQALALDANDRGARLLLAEAYTATGKTDAARNEYVTYLKARPKDTDALANYAALLEKQGNTAEAATTWDKIRGLAPNNPLPVLQRARLLRKLNRNQDALELYTAALKIAPKDANALIGLAETEAELGNTKKSLEYWKQVVAARPDYNAGYSPLLQVAATEGQLNATAQFLKGQLNKTPDRRAAYDAVLERFSAIGQEEQGRAWVEDFAQRYPKIEAPRQALIAFDRDKTAPAAEPAPTAAKTEPATLPITPDAMTSTPSLATDPQQAATADSWENSPAARAFNAPGDIEVLPDGELNAAPAEIPVVIEQPVAADLGTLTPALDAQLELTSSRESTPLLDETLLSAPTIQFAAPLRIAAAYAPPRLVLASAVTNPQLYLNR